MKTYFIRTYGCQQNERDSEIIEVMLQHLGLKPCLDWEEADLLILNSCSVRQASEDKIYGLGREVTRIKETSPRLVGLGPKRFQPKACLAAGRADQPTCAGRPWAEKNKDGDFRVIVMGCLVGSAKGLRQRFTYTALKKKLPWADALLSNEEISKLPDLLKDWGLMSCTPVGKHFQLKHLPVTPSRHAYVNISVGCDNFCAFCVVPYARGEERSRSREEILKEIKELVAQGVTKITLLGQNVNSWGLATEERFKIRAGSEGKLPFAHLLREIHQIPEIKQISFLSSNPFDFTNDLVETLALSKIDRYIHIALQSGDDQILKRMNRRHTVDEFMKLIEKIRVKVPGMKIGTDLIVGFPGESVGAFANTVKLCQKIKFDVVYVAMYCPREGTAAANMKDDVPKEEKRRRHKKLLEAIKNVKCKDQSAK